MSRVTRAKSLLVLTFFLLLLLLAVYPALAAPEPAGWYKQPSGTTSDISFISAVNPTVAWGTSSQGIIKTADGGNNWTKTTSQPALGPIAAVDANTAWVAGNSNFTICKTIDGGATWTTQFQTEYSAHWTYFVYGICAVDANTAWACGALAYLDTPDYGVHAVVMRTTDGGLNWSPAYFGNTGSMCLGISALDANTAWTCGRDTSTNSPVMKTVNGGPTWVPQAPVIPNAITTGISAVDENHAFAVSSTQGSTPEHSYILKTTDGSNWNASDMGTDFGVRGVEAVGPDKAWVVGTRGTILHTSDGTNWTAQQSGTTANLASISAVDANIAWASGASGTILHTTTGGIIPPPAPASISPAYAVQGTVVKATINGTGFQEGATVRLEGPTVINATGVTLVSPTQLSCTLDLWTNTPPLGKYDVVVRNVDGQEGKLVKGFSVTNICGGGAGASIAVFGCFLGLLSLTGTSRLVRRKRKR